jgi:PIN domain nuclease of toxin-antitoxin system
MDSFFVVPREIGDARLRIDWRDSISGADSEVYLSVVSIRGAIIKHRLGQLP